MDKYESGEYWVKNNDFHEADSDFKFQNFTTLLGKNAQVVYTGVADIGSGAGKISWLFSKYNPELPVLGVDLDANIIAYASKKYNEKNLIYQNNLELAKSNPQYDLVLLADVFEHIEDYIGFLKDNSKHFRYHLFNIPLDLSIKSLIFQDLITARNQVGHLHYFYDKLALQVLEENGYRVIDYLYADNILHTFRKKKGLSKIVYFGYFAFERVFRFIFGKSISSRMLGCYSLTVLCERKG